MSDYIVSNPLERYIIMLEERIGKLEDQLLILQRRADLQDRPLTKSSFKMNRSYRSWFVRVHLLSTLWPKKIEEQSKLCTDFFEQLDYFCVPNDDGDFTNFVFCSYVQSSAVYWALPVKEGYVIMEGILTSSNITITMEGIGAAFDRAFHLIMLPKELHPDNVVEEISNLSGRAIGQAIHCVNNICIWYCKDESDDESSVDEDYVEESARKLKNPKIKSLIIMNPRMHELFPAIFRKRY